MPITEVPPKNPVRSAPASGTNGSAYDRDSRGRTVDAPVLLIQLQDDLSHSRLREAFWISLIVHLLLVIGVVNAPRLFPQHSFALVTPGDLMKQRELTYLEMPPDAEKNIPKPNTDIISDKNRVAKSRQPALNRKELKKILDSGRAGAPGRSGAPTPASPPPSPAAVQGSESAQQNAQPQPPVNNTQTARLEPPPVAKSPQPFSGS